VPTSGPARQALDRVDRREHALAGDRVGGVDVDLGWPVSVCRALLDPQQHVVAARERLAVKGPIDTPLDVRGPAARRLIWNADEGRRSGRTFGACARIRARLRMTSEDTRLDLAGADEFSVVCESLPRTDPYAA
jgi:hypothetical protein